MHPSAQSKGHFGVQVLWVEVLWSGIILKQGTCVSVCVCMLFALMKHKQKKLFQAPVVCK